MNEEVKFLSNIGFPACNQEIVARGRCPFCKHATTFVQLYSIINSDVMGNMLPVSCSNCQSVLSLSYDKHILYPSQTLEGVEGLPEEINIYYQEALRCMSAESPNGAVTLFRKTIHAIGIHYNIAKKGDKTDFFEIINKLEADGHITKKIKDNLIGIKNIGNDGAHINNNEPDMSQAYILKGLMDSVLTLTIIDDQNLNMAKNYHKPNK